MADVADPPQLHVCFNDRSMKERAYARRRIEDVLQAAEAIPAPWPPSDEAVSMGRIELSRLHWGDHSDQHSALFESSRSNAPHLTLTLSGFGLLRANRRDDVLNMLKTALAALNAPTDEPADMSVARDLTDVARLMNPNPNYLPLLFLYPNQNRSILRLAIDPRKDGADQLEEHNRKLKTLLDQIRHLLPTIAQCHIEERGGTFMVRISPLPINPSDIDPIRAMHLIRQFSTELAASGYDVS